jgi:uncharacterized membrane protein (DUF485 family)
MSEHILGNPKFRHLVRTRNAWAMVLTALVVVVYFGYILLIAFDKEFLARKLGAGLVTSIGIPIGLGVILFTIVITAVYVHLANTRFDRMSAEVLREAGK